MLIVLDVGDVDAKLEEPLQDDYLAGYKKQLPTVKVLLRRLKPKHVSDPFTTEGGAPFSEVALLR